MDSDGDEPCSHGPGFPIRISPDHRLLASPRGFSQLAASFFAFLRLGIHTHALRSLTIKFTFDTECLLACSRLSGGSRRLCVLPVNILLSKISARSSLWWAWVELNYRPHPYQGCALAT